MQEYATHALCEKDAMNNGFRGARLLIQEDAYRLLF